MITTTGLARAAARAADMNLRASLTDLDVEQDRARRAVGGEIVEAIAEIDVDLVAERDDGGEARRGAAPPIRRARPRWRPIARRERDRPAAGLRAAKLALSSAAGAITPRQFGPTRRRPMPARGEPRLLCERARRRGRARRSRSTAAATPFAPGARRRSPGIVGGGVAMTTRSGALGEILEPTHAGDAVDRGVVRIDEVERRRETALAQVPQDRCARASRRAGSRRRARPSAARRACRGGRWT